VTSGSFKNEDQSEKLIRLLENQIAHVNEQNKALSQKLDRALDQIEFFQSAATAVNQTSIRVQNGNIKI